MLLPKLYKQYRGQSPTPQRNQAVENMGEAKQAVTNIFDIFHNSDELKDDDLTNILEKIKPTNVQKVFKESGIQKVVVLLRKHCNNPFVLKRLLDILVVLTQQDEAAREKVAEVQGIDILLSDILSRHKKNIELHKTWASLIHQCSSCIPFSVILLGSESLYKLLLEGLESSSDKIIVLTVLTYHNVCSIYPDRQVLFELKAVDQLSNALKQGSIKVKSAILDLLLDESKIETHKMLLVSCVSPLVDILEGEDNTNKSIVLDIILNELSQEGVKIIFTAAGGITATDKIFKTNHGELKEKAKTLLVALGVMEQSGGLIYGVLKGVGKVLDIATHGVKQVVVIPTVYTAKAVIDVLKFGTEDAKSVAIDVLLTLNDPDNVFATEEVLQPLIDCQKSDYSEKLKGKAAFSLGKITMNNPTAVEFIADDLQYAVDLLNSNDNEVKNTALQALWMFAFQPECKDRLKKPEIVELIKTIAIEGNNAELKNSAHKLLFQLGEWKLNNHLCGIAPRSKQNKVRVGSKLQNKKLTISIPSTPTSNLHKFPPAPFGLNFSTPTASSPHPPHHWEPPRLSEQVGKEFETDESAAEYEKTQGKTKEEIVGDSKSSEIEEMPDSDESESDSESAISSTQTEPKKGNHIMISYNWGVQDMVKEIKKGLDSAGFNVWLDIEQMAGSTLEAMANAVEQATVVLICYTKKYKESAACRTEAEYAFTLKKPIIPLKMEKDYNPDGWLGALLGSKLYHEFNSIEGPDFSKSFNVLVRELGERGKRDAIIEKAIEIVSEVKEMVKAITKTDKILAWTTEDVAKWLQEIGLENYQTIFKVEKIDGVALLELHFMLEKSSPSDFISSFLSPLSLVTLGDRLRFQFKLRELLKS